MCKLLYTTTFKNLLLKSLLFLLINTSIDADYNMMSFQQREVKKRVRRSI